MIAREQESAAFWSADARLFCEMALALESAHARERAFILVTERQRSVARISKSVRRMIGIEE